MDDLIGLLCSLVDKENLFVSLKESLQAATLTAITTALGGLLAGPPGLFFGMIF